MTAVAHVLGGSDSPTAGATTYRPGISSVYGSATATEAERQVTVRAAGKMSNLWCYVSANTTVTACTMQYRVAGANGNMAISIAGLATGEFEDVTNVDTVAAGDAVAVAITVPVGGALTLAASAWVFTPTDNSLAVSRMAASNNIAFSTASATRYHFPSGRHSNWTTTAANATATMRAAGTFRNLYVYVSANARTTATTFHGYKNGAATSQTVSVGSTATGVFEDVTNADDMAVGDTYTARMVTGTGTGSITVQVLGISWESTEGKGLLVAHRPDGVSVATASTFYQAAVSPMVMNATESAAHANAGVPLRFSNLAVRLTANTRPAMTYVLRVDGADTALSVAIGASSTGLFEDVTNSVLVPRGSLFNMKLDSSTGTNTATFTLSSVNAAASQSIPAPPARPRQALYRR